MVIVLWSDALEDKADGLLFAAGEVSEFFFGCGVEQFLVHWQREESKDSQRSNMQKQVLGMYRNDTSLFYFALHKIGKTLIRKDILRIMLHYLYDCCAPRGVVDKFVQHEIRQIWRLQERVEIERHAVCRCWRRRCLHRSRGRGARDAGRSA